MKKIIFVLILSTFYSHSKGQEVERLSKKVNSEFFELAPYITPDGKRLYFVRRGHPQNTKIDLTPRAEDIWYSDYVNGEWNEAIHMEKPFNQAKYNAIVSSTADGNQIFIGGFYEDGVYAKKGYSVSQLTKEGWSVPKGINVQDYEIMCKGDYISESFSADGTILITSFNENGTDNINDLYVSFKTNDGYTKPKKLPAPISTENGEGTPFLAPDNRTLYFSSNRPGGLGGYDMYMTRRLDDSWEKWSEPVNLGEPVNSPTSEAFFTIPAKGDYVYFVRVLGDQSDIVRTKLKKEFLPTAVTIVKGKVIPDAPVNFENVKLVYFDLITKKETKVDVNPVTGNYQIVLPSGVFYGFKAEAPGFYPTSQNIDLKKSQEYKEITVDIPIKEIKVGKTFVINNVFFDFAKADLKPESYYELDQIIKILNDNPQYKLEISGHTDNIGTDEFNMSLSQNRAAAVVNYLISKGINKNRLIAKGYGKTQPVADNSTEIGRQKNRRVEFKIL